MSSCNGCSYIRLKRRLKGRFLSVSDPMMSGWTAVYELDRQPNSGQGEYQEYEGHPVCFYASYASIGHSRDEDCEHLDKKSEWTPWLP